MSNLFWRDDRFPYIEIRKTENSRGEYKPHCHESFLSVGAIDSGDIVMHCCGKDISLCAGDMVFFNPNQIHSCNPKDGESRSYWMMHLDTDWCVGIQREIFGSDTFIPVVSGAVRDDDLYSDFISVCDGFLGSDIDAQESLVRMLADIFIKYCNMLPITDVSSVVIGEVADYLVSNPFISISLEELAERFHQNRFHLLRSFKAEFGLPPHAYHMNIRIEHAKKLLRDGEPIADVAVMTGFTDQSHFHRIFKKYTSATPGEYLKGQ